jgi:pyrroloquinoline quinone biosynthesis protein D
MGADEIPVIPRGVRVHHDAVRGVWVLLAPERVVTLDEPGRAVLSEIDGTRSLGQIAAGLAERFDAPAELILEDAAAFLGGLRRRRFLEVRA